MATSTHPPCWHVSLAAEVRGPDGRPLQRERPANLEAVFADVQSLLQEHDLAAPFATERLGVQCLFRRGSGLSRTLVELADRLHPYRWQIGIGFGTVDVEDASGVPLLTGTALDRARAALWTARRDRRSAVAVGFGEPEDSTISSFLELIDQIRGRWTNRQAETVRAARSAKGKEVAQRFGVSPSVVSESLKAASFRPLLRAELAFSELLDRFGTTGVWRGEQVRYPDMMSPISAEARRMVAKR